MASKPTKKQESAAIKQIISACSKLGWVASFKAENADDAVEYLIIGTESEVSRLTNIIEENERPTN